MFKFDEMLQTAINEGDESAMAKLKAFREKRIKDKNIAEKRKDLEQLFDDDFKMEIAASLLPSSFDPDNTEGEEIDRLHDEAYTKAEKLIDTFIKQILRA